MNVSLTPRLEEFVKQRIKSGLYNNASEVIREALRLMIERSSSPLDASSAPRKADVRTQLSALAQPLQMRGVSHLALFGSVVRGEAREDSDIDVMIDAAPEKKLSLIDLVAIKDFLEESLGRPIDLVTREGLDPVLKKKIMQEAETIF